MKTRFNSLTQSPDAHEGTLMNSNYSTERSPKTALLFEAKRTVVLPRLEVELSSTEGLSKTGRKVECSAAEH